MAQPEGEKGSEISPSSDPGGHFERFTVSAKGKQFIYSGGSINNAFDTQPTTLALLMVALLQHLLQVSRYTFYERGHIWNDKLRYF